MKDVDSIASRVAACPEPSNDGKLWSFYLINDGDASFDWAVLDEVVYTWGDMGSAEEPGARISGIAPGEHACIWRDDGDAAEVNIDLRVRVGVSGRVTSLYFEFPKLYKLRDLPDVQGLHKRGWVEHPSFQREDQSE